MKEATHFIYIPFTGLGKRNGFRGQDWYDLRAEIFKEYTLKSFSAQKNKNFILWISFRPEEKGKPTTEKIEKYVKETGLDYVFTFNGLMFYDDRAREKNATWEERLEKSLKTIRNKFGFETEKDEWVYLTIFATDDMFRNDVIDLIQKEKPSLRKALYNRKGYVYDYISKKLADWYNPYSIGNYTIIYPSYAFWNAKQHILYQDKLTSHEKIPSLFDAKELGEGLYCCGVHGRNISTTWGHPYKGKEYFYEEDKKKILKQFGIV